MRASFDLCDVDLGPISATGGIVAFARARSPTEGDPRDWTCEAAADLVEDLWRDLGHLCDRLGADFKALTEEAVGTGRVRVVLSDPGTGEPLSGADLAARPPLPENECFADLAALAFPWATDAAGVALATRRLRDTCERVGVWDESRALTALCAWSAERRDPELDADDAEVLPSRRP